MDFKTDTYPTPTYTDQQTARMMACLDQLTATAYTGTGSRKGAPRCASCGKLLDMDVAHIYDHDGGWGLLGELPKQWISFECKCGYHTSLNKLGVAQHG
jgi:hypothetical protein